MPYSMVGPTALGYDLARLPAGEHVATVVRTALRCTPRHLRRLSSHHPGEARRRAVWEAATLDAQREPMTSAMGAGGEALDLALRGDDAASAAVLQRLEQAALGDLGDLDRFVRHDLLDWTWTHGPEGAVQEPHAARAADVLVDAAASAFCTETSAPARRQMATAFLVTGLGLVDGSTVTGHDEVDRMLGEVAHADAATRESWRTAVDALRPRTTEWAPAMHQATWALHLSDRLRLAVDAQMAALTAFRAAGFTALDASYGVWNALSGAVQATAVEDLLAEPDRRVLMRAWDRVHGPS